MDFEKLNKPLHMETPLLLSEELSAKAGLNIWLKLETNQNTGSYKIRGIGNFVQQAAKRGCNHIVSSSGGNAGLAAAYACKKLGLQCTVVVPESTSEMMRDKIRAVATNTLVYGATWADANEKAKELSQQERTAMLSPFDHPDIWAGHSSIVDEVHKQLGNRQPDAVVVAVGGGGLFCGIMQGMSRNRWSDVPIVTVETEGARSFNICIEKGEWVPAEYIDTIAKTLAINKICKQAYDYLQEHKKCIHSAVVTDKQAVKSCLQFANDHRNIVSPSAGAALAAVYEDILKNLQRTRKLPEGRLDVVVIVCGGNEVDLKEVEFWKKQFDL